MFRATCIVQFVLYDFKTLEEAAPVLLYMTLGPVVVKWSWIGRWSFMIPLLKLYAFHLVWYILQLGVAAVII
jgi:hypothetical protein